MTEMRVVELAEQRTAALREQVPMDALPEFFDRAFGAVMAVMQAQQMAPAGPPFALYRGLPAELVDVEAGFPVHGVIDPAESVGPGTLPACRAVEAMHVGPYEALGRTYDEVRQRLQEEGLQPGDDMWEHYLTDPAAEPDPAGWRTLVVWPAR